MSVLQAKHVTDHLTALGVRCRMEGPDQEGRYCVEVPGWGSSIASVWEAEAFLRFVRSHSKGQPHPLTDIPVGGRPMPPALNAHE